MNYCLPKFLLISGAIVIQLYSLDSSLVVKYTEPYEITCEFDELKEPVKWLYNDSMVFSCEAPYRSGGCMIKDAKYRYNVDYERSIIAIRMNEEDILEWKRQDAMWRCTHGDQQDMYIFDQTESPQICSKDYPEDVLDLNSKATITVGVNSTRPYTVTWSSKRKGVLQTDKFNATNRINDASISVHTTCLDNVDTFTYLVDNGASFPVSESFYLKVRCETVVREDEMDKTVEVELGQDAMFKVLYTGDKEPTNITWYRRMDPDLEYLSDYRIQKTSSHELHSMGIIIQSVQKQDAGTYTAEFHSATKKTFENFELTIKPDDSDPLFNWSTGLAIGAGSGIIVCVVIFIAIIMIGKIKSKTGDDYLSPNSVPETPPPPMPHYPPTTGTSTQSYADSAFDSVSETYENLATM